MLKKNIAKGALVCLLSCSLTGCTEETKDTFEPEPLTIYTPEDADTAINTVTDQDGVCLYQYEGSVGIHRASDGKTYITVIQNNQVTK